MIVNAIIERRIDDMVKTRERWGKSATGKFSIEQLEEMLTYLYGHRTWLTDTTVPKELYNKTVRQLTAANARLAKYEKKEREDEPARPFG